MRRYEVKLTTTATTVVIVDASDSDEACDFALDLVNEGDIEFHEYWDIQSVEQVDPRD